MNLRRRTLLQALGAATLLGPAAANAQGYPAKPIRIVHGYDNGSNPDTVARILSPSLSERILTQLVRRLRDAEDQIEVLMLRDTQSKVVSALLKMAQSRGPVADGAGPVELLLSPVELSSRVGLDVETVKRTVQRLRDQQYLRIVGERVEIPDVEALRRLYSLLGTTEELRGER